MSIDSIEFMYTRDLLRQISELETFSEQGESEVIMP